MRRLPGQSLRDKKEDLFDNRFTPLYVVAVFFWVLWAYDTWRLRTHQPLQPQVTLCLAILCTGLSAIAVVRLLPKFRALNRGEQGELKVGEALEELREIGYRPYHDLRRDGYNIDHVVVGPAGVFAIETKFRSGQGEIEFRNGEDLFVAGHAEEKDSLKQARGSALEVNRMIKENCGLDRWVYPLVVFVGNWKVKNQWRETDARVLTSDQLQSYFAQRQPELTRSEIKLIASHLERSAKG